MERNKRVGPKIAGGKREEEEADKAVDAAEVTAGKLRGFKAGLVAPFPNSSKRHRRPL